MLMSGGLMLGVFAALAIALAAYAARIARMGRQAKVAEEEAQRALEDARRTSEMLLDQARVRAEGVVLQARHPITTTADAGATTARRAAPLRSTTARRRRPWILRRSRPSWSPWCASSPTGS